MRTRAPSAVLKPTRSVVSRSNRCAVAPSSPAARSGERSRRAARQIVVERQPHLAGQLPDRRILDAVAGELARRQLAVDQRHGDVVRHRVVERRGERFGPLHVGRRAPVHRQRQRPGADVHRVHLARIEMVLAHQPEHAVDDRRQVHAARIDLVAERLGQPHLAVALEGARQRRRARRRAGSRARPRRPRARRAGRSPPAPPPARRSARSAPRSAPSPRSRRSRRAAGSSAAAWRCRARSPVCWRSSLSSLAAMTALPSRWTNEFTWSSSGPKPDRQAGAAADLVGEHLREQELLPARAQLLRQRQVVSTADGPVRAPSR